MTINDDESGFFKNVTSTLTVLNGELQINSIILCTQVMVWLYRRERHY